MLLLNYLHHISFKECILKSENLMQLQAQPSIYTDGAKKGCEEVQPVGPTRAAAIYSSSGGVTGKHRRHSSLYHSIPGVLTRRAGCAYTRAPASTHVVDADVRTRATRPRRAHVDAPFACSKDIQSVGRVGRIERKRRQIGASEANKRERIYMCMCPR